MGGAKTYVPYPSFYKSSPQPSSTGYLAAVGKCRIYPETCLISSSTEANDNGGDGDDHNDNREFQSILEKAIEQSRVGQKTEKEEGDVVDSDEANKKLKKKYMKEGIAMAQSYLSKTLALDTSVVDVEMVLKPTNVIESDGCIVSCFLDAGCDKVVFLQDDDSSADDVNTANRLMLEALDASRVPKERLVVQVRDGDGGEEGISSYLTKLIEYASTISVYCGDTSTDPLPDLQTACTGWTDALSALSSPPPQSPPPNRNLRLVLETSSTHATATPLLAAHISALASASTPAIPAGVLLLLRDTTPTHLGETYTSCIRTDRPDKLYTTVVCSRAGEALGLVYSSVSSVIAALECGRGVYYSRSRGGLWRKGDTSGMYQVLHRIDVDCDGDALRFVVTQLGGGGGVSPAFCHLGTYTCWGEGCGVRDLEDTLRKRLEGAPEGSYTKRLFEDGELLRDKLVEEAQELSEAEGKEHVAEELADVLYFAMVKAVKAGVSIDDAIGVLDRRRKKVTRRKGDSKAFRIAAGDAILSKKAGN